MKFQKLKNEVKKSLLLQLSMFFITIFLLAILISVLFSYHIYYIDKRKDYISYNSIILRELEEKTSDSLKSLNNASSTIMSNEIIWNALIFRKPEYITNDTLFNDTLNMLLSNLYNNNAYITEVTLYIPKLAKLYLINKSLTKTSLVYSQSVAYGKIESSDWYQWAIKQQPGAYDYRLEQKTNALNISTAVTSPFSGKIVYAMRITVDNGFFKNLLKGNLAEHEDVLLFNSEKTYFYSTSKDFRKYFETIHQRIMKQKKDTGYFNVFMGHNKIILYKVFKNRHWVIAKAINKQALESSLQKNSLSFLFFGFIISFLIVTVTIIYSKKITAPIINLANSMSRIEKDNFNFDLECHREDELGILYQKFSQMIKRINTLIEEEYTLKLQEKQSRMDALQRQINPHFIYNVLQLLSSIAIENGNTEIEQIADAFGLLLRYNLANRNREVFVLEEVDAVSKYIFILQMRYRNKLKVEITTEEECKTCKMLPFILQPLVENSLNHGLRNKIGLWQVNIKISHFDNHLVITVKDNGIGMDKDTLSLLNNIPEETSGGSDIVGGNSIRLITNRIRLLYGDDFGIHFTSYFNIGTTVTIQLPFAPGEQKI